MPDTLSDRVAILTVRDYCCATCWGHLEKVPAEGRRWNLICAKYGSEHQGFVTKHYAEQRRSESVGELIDVRAVLQNAGVIVNKQAGKSTDTLLSELGI